MGKSVDMETVGNTVSLPLSCELTASADANDDEVIDDVIACVKDLDKTVVSVEVALPIVWISAVVDASEDEAVTTLDVVVSGQLALATRTFDGGHAWPQRFSPQHKNE